jgi:BirA family transcriptional regulator, biotin operon repressor / biotin---[acetyl-CoA-carboxylase] ligase
MGLMAAIDTIDSAQVNEALAHTRLGGYVMHLATVSSTNTLALEAARQGSRFGVWVADEQTAGRGRGGHAWHSAPGNGLYVSALFTPRLPASALRLSLIAGIAAWDAIREVSGLTVDIRWPNDLVTRDSPSRKLGGILVETAVAPAENNQPAMLRYAVIGIGINVGHESFPAELAKAATSLKIEGWDRARRQPLLIALLDKLDLFIRYTEDGYAGTRNGPDLPIQYDEASTWVRGKRVHVAEQGGYTGMTAGLDEQGFLRVTSDDGVLRTVLSGGVREAD